MYIKNGKWRLSYGGAYLPAITVVPPTTSPVLPNRESTINEANGVFCVLAFVEKVCRDENDSCHHILSL